MESESDTENEQLQHDILQINEVLCQGEDEGDDSDWELEIDDTVAADDDDHSIVFIPDDGLVETNESGSYQSSLQQHIDQPFSQTTHQNQLRTSEECSLEDLLLINQESQRNLQKLLNRVKEELERNHHEQVKVSNNPSNREEKNLDLSIMGLFRDYMELLQDGAGRKPPKNEDTKQRMSGDRPGPFVLKQKKWNETQRESLLEAVKTEGRKRIMQPLLNRREILEMKMDRLSVPEMLEKVYEEIENNKEELVKTESIPSEELLGDRFREVDWDTTANVYLEAERSAKECQLQWQNLLHPSISRKKWTAREKAELICIARKHEGRDWEAIAEELGTGRTALQCLRVFQLQDKSFVKPTFTDEEDALLKELSQRLQVGKYVPFPKVAYFMEGHTQLQVLYRWMRKIDPDIKTGKFTQEEDDKLKKLITVYGAKNWARLAELMSGRTQFQIRHRWMTVLSPFIKSGPWDYQETMEFLQKVKEQGVGNWSKVAAALHKNPGEKERTSYHLLQRFKNLVASYMTWRNNSSNQVWKIEGGNEDELLGSQLADQLLAYLPLKQKAKEEAKERRQAREEARTRKELEGVKKRTRRRKRKAESSDEEEDEDDDDDDNDDDDDDDDDDLDDFYREVDNDRTQFLSQEQYLTARQKALAQGKEIRQETILVRQKQSATALEIKKREKRLRRANKQLIMSKLDSMDKDIVSEQEEEEGIEDVDPYDARNEDDDDGAETHNGAGPSSGTIAGRIRGNIVSNHLSGWQQKLKDREAAQTETHISRNKESGIKIHAGLSSANYDPEGKGLPRWMETLKLKERVTPKRKTSGRKPYSELDMELIKAVDPMWVCRGKGSGRHSSRQLSMQKRTRQEKLSYDDQKMMFKLLLQVLDVDIEYASTKVRFSLQVPSEANAMSEKSLPVIQTTQRTSDGAAIVCQKAGTNSAPGVTSDSKAMTRTSQLTSGGCEMIRDVETTKGSQTVTGCTQPVTIGHQGVISSLPGVTNGPQPIAGGLPVVTVGPQVLTAGSPAMATSPFLGHNISLGMNTFPHIMTRGNQVVTFGPQTVITSQPSLITAPLGVTSGPHLVLTGGTHSQNGGLQAVTSGPQILASYPEAIATGPQAVARGPRVVASDLQTVASTPQAIASGPQEVASGPQAVTNVLQAVTSFPQAMASGPQAVTSVPQAMTSVQQAVASGPQAMTSVASFPQAMASGPQAMTSIASFPQAMASGPQAMASGPQAVTSVLQAMTSVQQAVASGPQAVASVQQAVASGPQAMTSGPQAVTSVPQAMTSVQQAVASGPQAVASGPQAVTSGPQAVASVPQAVTSVPQAMTSVQQAVASGPQAVTSGPQAVASVPPAVASVPQAVTSVPQAMTSVQQAVTSVQQAVASGPQAMTSVPQAMTSVQQAVTSVQQAVASGPQAVASGPQAVTSVPQAVTSVQQAVASGPQAVASGPQAVTSGPQAVASVPPAVASVPPAVASVPQAVTSVLQAVTSVPQAVASVLQAMASGPQAVASDLKAVTGVPPAVDSDPQAMTRIQQAVASSPQAVTSVLKAVASGPQVVSGVPPAVASGPQAMTSVQQAVASGPQAVTSVLQAVASDPHAMTCIQQAVASVPQAITSVSPAVAIGPGAVTNVPQAVASGLQAVTSIQQAVASVPQAITSDPPAVASGLQAVTSIQQAVASVPQAITSVSPAVAIGPGAITNVPQAVGSGLQAVASGLQTETSSSNLQSVTCDKKSHEISTKTLSKKVVTPTVPPSNIQPEKTAKDGMASKGSSQRKRGRILSVRKQLELQRGKLAQTVSSSPESVTQNNLNPTPLLSSPRNQVSLLHNSTLVGISSPTHVQSGFNQSLSLAGGKNPGQNQSTPPSLPQNTNTAIMSPAVTQRKLSLITDPLAVGAPGASGSLLPIGNLAQVSKTALGTSGDASNQYLMFRDNQTGQVLLSQLPSALVKKQPGGLTSSQGGLTSSQSQVMPFPPVAQNQGSPRMLQNLLSGLAQQQNQIGSQPAAIPTPITSGNTQLQVHLPPSHDQFSAASTLQAISQLVNPVVHGTGVNPPASQDTRMNRGTLHQSLHLLKTHTPQTQRGTIPQTVSLPSAHQNVGSFAPQEQHITSFHTGNPPTAMNNSQEPQPKQQPDPASFCSESAPKQVEAQQSPSVVQNTTDLTSANLKSLSLPNGNKLVITTDQFKSLEKGNLGNVTGHMLTPMPRSHEKKKKKKSKKDKRHQAKLKKKRARLKKHGKQSKKQSEDTSTDSAKKDPPPIKKRKLHTKDISLLPPNIATIQALKSLLLDRKNLEESRSKFMSELEKRLIKSEKADGEQTAHFSGYLEGRKTAQEKTRETIDRPTTLPSAEPGSSNNQRESVISELLGQLAPTGLSTNDSEGLEKATSPQELVEEHLSSLKKTDSYQLLQRRFLSLFLWPGLLSSTRIKGMISVNLGDKDSYDQMPRKPKQVKKRRESPGCQQPVVKKHADQPICKNTAGVPSPTVQVTLESQRSSEGLLQDQSVVEIGGSKTHCNNDQFSANQAPSTSGHCVVKDPATNSVGVVPGSEGGTITYDHGVLARGKKRKAEDSSSSFGPHHEDEEQRISEEGDDDSGIPQNRKRKVSESNYTDAMKALTALQNFDV